MNKSANTLLLNMIFIIRSIANVTFHIRNSILIKKFDLKKLLIWILFHSNTKACSFRLN